MSKYDLTWEMQKVFDIISVEIIRFNPESAYKYADEWFYDKKNQSKLSMYEQGIVVSAIQDAFGN